MIRIVLMLLLTGFVGSMAVAQDKQASKLRPTDKMILRMNTRDRVMISKGNASQFRMQGRKSPVMQKGQMLQQRRMMTQQRHNRQQQMHQQAPRKATERQMMQQRQRQSYQRNQPGGPR
ncbi:MAG: hypothetical protein JW801_16030 [Bacteroidales bacterium]|nr:hypothetical protein [Bacteroidales bacterium]